MTPEYKRKTEDLLNAVATRVNIIDEMLTKKREPSEIDAKRYMREIKNALEKINNIVAIS